MKNLAFLLLFSAALFAGCRWADAPKSHDGKTTAGARVFNADYQPGIKLARLTIDGAACSFKLSDTTGKLFHAGLGDSTRHFSMTQGKDDSSHFVDFKMEKEDDGEKHSDNVDVTLELNPNPVWDLDLKTAASATDFDLSAFKIRNLKINCAAGGVKLKLKPALPDTYLDITSSVAAVDLSIPKDAACEVETDSSLGGTDFEGFDKKDDSHYQTPGFATAKIKIHIKAKVSVAAFNIKRF
jgi:hypothetical protein